MRPSLQGTPPPFTAIHPQVCPPPARCRTFFSQEGPDGQAAAELEAMWPSSRFSYGTTPLSAARAGRSAPSTNPPGTFPTGVRVAKRALINRLGGSAAVACG